MSGHDLHLPPEIWTQILTRLPVKSIVRFRCVRKTWYSLVSCPNFISDVETLNRSSRDRMLLHHYDTRNRLSNFSFHGESFVESHEHPDVPEPLRSLDVRIAGSCDGLICFSKLTLGVTVCGFLIWNPSIGKAVDLPPPPSPFHQTYSYISGFGFDSESRDYKVVRIEYHKSSDYQIHIFDLRKGVWRSSSSPMSRSCFGDLQPAVYLHGNLHCVGTDRTSPNYNLVSFDLSSEVLHETEMKLDGDPLGRYPHLLLIDGLLSVAKVKNLQGDYCTVWSMKEYGVTESWTKLFTIELPYSKTILTPLRFWENGEVLLVERAFINQIYGGDVLLLYNTETKKSVTVLSTSRVILNTCFYKESLVSP